MVRKAFRRVNKGERGQALIELAFILPIILVITLTLVDFSRGIDHRDVLQHAVREGARMAAVDAAPSDPAVVTETVQQSQGLLTAPDVTVCYPSGTGNRGDPVRVKANYTFKFSVGGGELLSAFGVPVPSISMTPSFDFALEQPLSGAATPC